MLSDPNNAVKQFGSDFNKIGLPATLMMIQYKNIAVFSEKTNALHLPNQSMVANSVTKLWPWKLGQGHQNLISYRSCPIYNLGRLANLVTFHPVGHEITCRQTLFALILVDYVCQWPWKFDQGHQNLFSFLSCPNVISMQIWLKSAKLVHEILCTQAPFGSNLAI